MSHYGAFHREALKCQCGEERRVKKFRRALYHFLDACSDFLHMIGALFGFALAWVALDGVLRWFR